MLLDLLELLMHGDYDWTCTVDGDIEFCGWKLPGRLSWRQECYIEMSNREISCHGTQY
jgi:hypothetical protein